MDISTKQKRWTIRLSFKPLIRFLPGLFYLANLIRMLTISSTPYLASLYGIGGLGILMALFNRRYRLVKVLLFYLLYGLTLVINWVLIGNVSFSSIVVNVLLIGITFIMLLRQWTYKEGRIVFYITALFMLYSAISRGNARRILISSNNYVSVLMLLAVSFYYIAVDLDSRKLRTIDILPAFMCFLLAIWARGRGGILSTAVLLVLIVLIYLKKLTNKRVKRTIFVIVILFAVGVFLLIRNINLYSAFMTLGKWGTRGTDNAARIKIWGAYFSKMGESIGYILAGAPLSSIPIIAAFGGNCHNSFIQLHAYNGIITFAVFFVMTIQAIVYYLKNENYVMAAMAAVIILRGSSDKFIFGQYGMPIMLFFALYPIIAKQQNARKNPVSSLPKGQETIS